MSPVQQIIQLRRSTASQWTTTNPVLHSGELGVESDTGKFKIGDGTSTWTALSYAGGGGGGGSDFATDTHAASVKATPVDADEFPLVDSAATFGKKKWTWANVKAAMKSYLDSATSTLTNKDLTSGTNTFPTLNQSTTGNAATATKLVTARNINGIAFDGTGNIEVVAAGTHAAASKTTPVDADAIPLIDSAASNGLKQLTIANLRAFILAAVDDALDAKQDTATLLDDVLTVLPGVMLARGYDNVADAWPTVDTALLTDTRVTLVWEESDESTPPPTSAGTVGKPQWLRKTS